MATYDIELHVRPAKTLRRARLAALVTDLRAVAGTCFDELPDYQCISGRDEILERNVIAVARRPDGIAAGFCSALLIPVEGVGDVLHLGLTCVRPEDRGSGLTHELTSRVLLGYLAQHRPFERVWVSNVACVLSSLGNVAVHFDEVYPAPWTAKPTDTHKRIANTISGLHREDIYIQQSAHFDQEDFVFKGSNAPGNMFCKQEEDERFHHRESALNGYYAERMDFEAGDEILQIGHVSLRRLVAYGARRAVMPKRRRRRVRRLRRASGQRRAA
ncbi:MAG: hypothetical protein KC502_20800 [Myxococcales bacterium]|nr:hypothetical protein [Myxococcales bacterium]